MTWVAAFIVFILTAVASFPALIGAAVFGELLGEGDLRAAATEHGVEVWHIGLLAVMSVVPNLVGGLFSGAFALAVGRRLVPAADTGAVVVTASVAALLHLLAAPLLFPESALASKVVQVTGALTAYAAVAMAMGDLDDVWRVRMRRAWTVLMVLAMVECAVVPFTVLTAPETEAGEE